MALSATETQDRNRSEVPVQTTTNTPWGNMIMKCLATRQSFDLPQYTTLNERYNVLADESIGRKRPDDFELKYFGVGIRGANCVGTDPITGVSRMKVNQHQPSDANLFTHIPVACRPLDNDFDNVNRDRFRLRVVENDYNGVPCAFYYLRLINFDEYNPQVLKVTRDENNNESSVPHVPTRDSLFNPQPEEFTSEGSVPITGTYLNNSGILDCSFDTGALQEVANACKAKYNDAGYASINETMICWGVDTKTDGMIGNGATIRYNEVTSAVVAHFITEKDARSALANTYLNMKYDHGSSDPMLLHTTSTSNP